MRLRSGPRAIALGATLAVILGGLPAHAVPPASPVKATADATAALFDPTRVRDLRLTLTPEAWKAMQPPNDVGFGRGFGRPGGRATLRGEEGDAEGAPTARSRRGGLAGRMGLEFPRVRATLVCDGETYPDVALRYKGNGTFLESRGSLKRPLKLEFHTFAKDRRFHGVKTLNLNNNVTDPSFMREVLAYELFRAAGVPSPRTGYARVYLTVPGEHEERYLGLYTMVEQVDDLFLRRHFGTGNALLLKPDFVTGLPHLGTDWSAYETPYRPRMDGTAEARERFIALTKLIQEADDPTLRERIGSFLDLDQFARFLAATVLLSNLDSILVMGQNYYLCLPSGQTRFVWVPWDLDRAFGNLLGSPEELAKLSITHPHAADNRLIERLLAIPDVDRSYRKHLRALIDTEFTPGRIGARIAAIAPVIRPAVAQQSDEALRLFDLSLSETGAGEAPAEERRGFGWRQPRPTYTKRFVATRVESVRDQLEGRSEGIRTRGRNIFGQRGGRGPFGGGAFPFGPGAFLAGPILDAADVDRDGKLSLEELRQRAADWSTRWDADGSGDLDIQEFRDGIGQLLGPPPGGAGPADARERLAPPAGEAPPGAGARPRERGRRGGFGSDPVGAIAAAIFRAADLDRNDRLSPLEFRQTVCRWFREWDADQSGALDRDEIGPGLGRLLEPPGAAPPAR